MKYEIRTVTGVVPKQMLHEIAVLGALMHGESPRFRALPYVPSKVEALAQNLAASPTGLLLLAFEGDTVVGILAGAFIEHFFSTAVFFTDLVLFVHPEHRSLELFRKLVLTLEQRVADAGVYEVNLGISTEVHMGETLKLYQHFGYRLSSYGVIKQL